MMFHDDGFAVCYRHLDDAPLEEAFHDIRRLFASQVRSLDEPSWSLQEDARLLLIRDRPERYIATARETQNLPSVHRLLVSKRLTDLAQRFGVSTPLISTKASVHIMHPDLVVPGGYHRSPAHQDWRSMQGSLDSIVLWIPLTPVRGNGLEVIRGSHKHGLLPTRDHVMTPEVIDPEQLGPWEAIDTDPGDVLAFSSFLVHRTAKGPGLRIAISTRFNNAAEPTFIERGYPSPYKYSYQRELITPDFPPKGPA